jgi:hypothetical protein
MLFCRPEDYSQVLKSVQSETQHTMETDPGLFTLLNFSNSARCELHFMYFPILLSIYLFHIGEKVMFALEQAMKAQRGSRGIALFFL